MRDNLTKTATLYCLAVFLFSGCSTFDSRPVRQMAYAEAAYQAALTAGAESNPETIPVFQLAKDQLSRARSYYRLKNFKEARRLSVLSRRLSEDAEWRAVRGNSGSKDVESLVK
ncbi:MAG: DUF4398 domain-containing protein [Proteobacteria bacterium]|nr:MAG: DUF4398 domain-containing protein [Pseudomonadota bacterium]